MRQPDDKGSFAPLIFLVLLLTGILWTIAEVLPPLSTIAETTLKVVGGLLVVVILIVIWVWVSGKQHSSNTTSKVDEADEVAQTTRELAPLPPLQADAVKNWDNTPEQDDRVITPEMLRDLYSLPKEDLDIVGNYGQIVQEVIELQPGPLYPVSKLLDPKETIRQSIENLLKLVQDPTYRQDLEMGLFLLENFIPDEEVPDDPDENRQKWMMLRCGHKS